MSRVRSPNYPSLSLPEALQRIRTIHAAERHLAAPKEVIAKHLGYGGMNGASIKVISALGKYGLLEEVGPDKLRVSSRAITILYPKDDAEKQAALEAAAFAPTLFTEIAQEWGGDNPSDQNLKAYLVRRNFADDAIDRVIESYRETMELVTRNVSDYDSPNSTSEPQMQAAPEPVTPAPSPSAVSMPLDGDDPYRLSFSKSGGIEVVGRLNDAEAVDDLIKSLEALKGLLKAN